MAANDAISIVPAERSHAPLLRDLAEQTFRQAYAADTDARDLELYVQQNFQLAHILAHLDNPQAQYLLAKVADQYAGYALLRWDATHPLLQGTRALKLNRIYLLQTFWRLGLGTSLLQYVLHFAKNAGYEWLWLVVWEENHRAMQFYKKWGFEHFGYESFQYGTQVGDDWALRLRL